MINIYGINLNQNGTVNTGKVLIQDIPAANGVHLLSPNIKLGIESSGTLNFSIQPDDMFYDQFMQLTTLISVEYGSENIFYGRVLTVENGFYGEHKITCEGAISLLLDTYYPPEAEKDRATISVKEYLDRVIGNHNKMVENNSNKTFYLGEVPGKYSSGIESDQRIDNEEYAFGNSSWTQTKNILDDLKSHYGGCWRTRISNNKIYLDWLDQYFNKTINTQKIEVGKNLLEASESTEVDNIFTRVIPIGKQNNNDLYLTGYRKRARDGSTWTFSDKWFDVKDLLKVYSDQELSTGYHQADDYRYSKERYGVIWKIVTFDDMSTQDTLFNAAMKWVKDNYHGSIESVQVTAVDMHMVDGSSQQINVGDRVYLKFPYGKGINPPIIERLLTCLEISYDLYNPDSTSYKFGVPSMALTKNYRSSGKSTKKESTSSGYTPSSSIDTTEDDFDKWMKQTLNWLKSKKVWYKHNNNTAGGPTMTDSSGATHPPFFWLYDSEMGSDGRAKVWVWRPTIKTVSAKGEITWLTDEQGRVQNGWILNEYSNLNYKLIESYHLFEYVSYEYEYDLRNGGKIKMPAVIPADENGGVTSIITNLLGGTTSIGGGISFLTGLTEGETGGIISKIAEFIGGEEGGGFSVLNLFNNAGQIIAKVLGDDGTIKFAKIDDEGNVMTDDDGNVLYEDVRNINRTTQDLKTELEAMDITVTLLDDQVTLIGQTVGDETYGLVKDVAEQGRTITTISSDLIVLGQNVDRSLADMTRDITALGDTVTILSSDVTVIGQKVGDETSGLIKDLADLDRTVTVISSDVVAIGDDMTQAQADIARNGQSITAINTEVTSITSQITTIGGDLEQAQADIASQGRSITAINTQVTSIGGDLTQAQADIASQGQSITAINSQVTSITSQVTSIGGDLEQAQADIASQGRSITAINTQVTSIGGDLTQAQADIASQGQSITAINSQVTSITSQVTSIGGDLTEAQADIASQGRSITAINSDIVDITGELNAAKANISNLQSDFADIDKLNARIGNISIMQANLINTTGISGSTATAAATFNSYYGNNYYVYTGSQYGTPTNLAEGVYDVKLETNNNGTYTIYKRNYQNGGGSWVEVGTFERAASGGIDYLTGNWSGTASRSTLTIGTSPDSGKTYTIGFNGVYDQNLNVYSNGTPTKTTSNPKILIIPVKVATVGTSAPYTQTTRYETTVNANASEVYDDGYNSAHVTGSWSGNVFTYKKTTSGSSNTGKETVNVGVGAWPQDTSGDIYAYASRLNGGGSYDPISTSARKKLTITDVTDNTVKLQVAGSNTGLTYAHNKWTAGNNAVTLNDASWQYSGDTVDSESKDTNTVTISTSGRSTQLSKTATIYLNTSSSWQGQSKTIYVQKNNSSGEHIAVGSVTAPAPTVNTWALTDYSSPYSYKATVKVNGTTYTSGTLNAVDAYAKGWTNCYGNVGLDSTTAKTLGYGESVTVYAQAYSTKDATAKSNAASRTITAPAFPTVSDWSLGSYSSPYSYKASVKIGGTTYTSGTLNAVDAYAKGWTNCYSYVGLDSTTAKTLGHGESVTVYAQAYSTKDATAKSNAASRTITAKSLTLEDKGTKYATTSAQTFTTSSGYDGMSKLVIGAVTTTNLSAENIRNGVIVKVGDAGNAGRIASIAGTYSPSVTLEDKGTKYATTSTQTFTPSSGYDGMSKIVIRAVSTSNLSAENIRSGVTVKVGDSGDSGRIANIPGTFTSTVSQGQTKADASKILSGYSAYIDGSEIAGSISSKSAATYNVSSSDRTISSGQYLSGAQTIRGVTTTNLSDGSKILSGTIIKVGDSADAGRIVSIVGTHTCPTYYATGSWSGARFNLSTTTTSSSALDYYDADVTISQIGSNWYEYLRVMNKGVSSYTTISSTQKQIRIVNNGDNAVKLQLSNGTSWFDKLSYTHNKFPNSIVCTDAHDYASNDNYADINYGGTAVQRTIAAKNIDGTNLKTTNFAFMRTTYTNSSGVSNQRCVNMSLGGVRIGRIDIQDVYIAGWNAVSHSFVLMGPNDSQGHATFVSSQSIGYGQKVTAYPAFLKFGKTSGSTTVDDYVWGKKYEFTSSYTHAISVKQAFGYASARKMKMYYEDNVGNMHAAADGASLYWYFSATDLNNTGSYKSLYY